MSAKTFDTTDKNCMITTGTNYTTNYRLFNYQGDYIGRGPASWYRNYLTHQGTFAVTEWGEAVYAFINPQGYLQEADRILMDPGFYYPYKSYKDSNIYHCYVSSDDRFLVTPINGIFENRDNQLIQVLPESTFPSNIESAVFINNGEYIMTKFWSDKEILRLYDSNLELQWEGDDLKGDIYSYPNGFILVQDNKLLFYNIEGELQHETRLTEKIEKIFSFDGKDFVLIQNEGKLIQMNFSGKILGQVELEPPFTLTSNGEGVYKYNALDEQDYFKELIPVKFIYYQIQY